MGWNASKVMQNFASDTSKRRRTFYSFSFYYDGYAGL